MRDAQEQSHANWRQLQHEWQQAQEGWHDITTACFAAHFWEPLASETKDYLRALNALMETLRAAQDAVR